MSNPESNDLRPSDPRPSDPRPSGARFIALGILASRVFGLVRQVAVGRFFGVGAHTDVWQSAMRLPNVLQNLLGEQSLSAAFIPTYSRLLAEGKEREAARFAGAVFALLACVVSILVLFGVVFAKWIVMFGAWGFTADAARVAAGEIRVDRFELAVRAVRVIFPMTGFLVLAAWALGVLNSHRRFFLSYMAPVAWNVAIITALVGTAYRSGFLLTPRDAGFGELDRWLIAGCLGGVVGGLLQFLVQLPAVLREMKGLPLTLTPLAVPGVRGAVRAFGPALLGRGVVQLSLYINLLLASWLHEGALSALGFAVILINLPLGAFGMSVAAAELPELSRASSRDRNGALPPDMVKTMSGRLDRALRQASFVLCPSVVGYLVFGFLVANLIFGGGRFTLESSYLVYAVLVGYTLGLLASAASRLLQNTFFALGDTRTPARIAFLRLMVDTSFGVALMFWFDRYSVTAVFGLEASDQDHFLGAFGLSLAASLGAWVELLLLRRRIVDKMPGLELPSGAIGRLLFWAVLLALPAVGVWLLLPAGISVKMQALLVLPIYPLVYLGFAWWRASPELDLWLGRLRRRG